ncbi:MAG: HipA N-terminal domain-containing protein [Candidatus Marinimicrobia bacterium]|nr:HipA N-terminal domain-containing protein [Candidatus Neomarinimicrobiota bacterium]MCF7903924.1 HipA N-terminal domain-containing protein [Candidatus Neomarinimicrobiota bacterium]
MKRLEVIYKGKVKAGELWVDDDGFHFEYDDAFREDVSTRPISVNMPKKRKSYQSNTLFPYFRSILSEGENRKQICKALGIDPSDEWSLLAMTCQYDTIGAITVRSKDHGTV